MVICLGGLTVAASGRLRLNASRSVAPVPSLRRLFHSRWLGTQGISTALKVFICNKIRTHLYVCVSLISVLLSAAAECKSSGNTAKLLHAFFPFSLPPLEK